MGTHKMIPPTTNSETPNVHLMSPVGKPLSMMETPNVHLMSPVGKPLSMTETPNEHLVSPVRKLLSMTETPNEHLMLPVGKSRWRFVMLACAMLFVAASASGEPNFENYDIVVEEAWWRHCDGLYLRQSNGSYRKEKLHKQYSSEPVGIIQYDERHNEWRLNAKFKSCVKITVMDSVKSDNHDHPPTKGWEPHKNSPTNNKLSRRTRPTKLKYQCKTCKSKRKLCPGKCPTCKGVKVPEMDPEVAKSNPSRFISL